MILNVVSNISKISIKQQFTTKALNWAKTCKLFRIFQRSQLNSNSQPFKICSNWRAVVSNISKISIKQQFTTVTILLILSYMLFRIFQRSQLNSNSQRKVNVKRIGKVVSNISKISIKQQFTTLYSSLLTFHQLFRIFQRSQLNSNSQLQTYQRW